MEANDITPSMCTLCGQFYGNPMTKNLCSGCYRQAGKSPQHRQQPPASLLPDQPLAPAIEDQRREEGAPCEQRPEVQTDPSKCFGCKRKVGMLGFKCRCQRIFCKLHRMPQQHQCKFDFGAVGRTRLREQNPQVRGKKVQDI